MKDAPIIMPVVMARDWQDAFRILWIATFGRTAAPCAGWMTYIKWPERRRLCRGFATQCIEESNDLELAAAWACVGIGPNDASDPDCYRPIFSGLAKAVISDPSQLDDRTFVAAIAGWRYLVNNPDEVVEKDLIAAAARGRGAEGAIDTSEMLQWARAWAEERS